MLISQSLRDKNKRDLRSSRNSLKDSKKKSSIGKRSTKRSEFSTLMTNIETKSSQSGTELIRLWWTFSKWKTMWSKAEAVITSRILLMRLMCPCRKVIQALRNKVSSTRVLTSTIIMGSLESSLLSFLRCQKTTVTFLLGIFTMNRSRSMNISYSYSKNLKFWIWSL